ncbi:PREDICTED: SAGA-associated factor 29 [Diuraphis noxia]|uniref:SAGA-associated factor 29 n=1 Tax=Diuraphis noxia TaxID=143948 RepID=UPI00076389E5|nr:PREDICTED: SAGA-associated factor 29 [Diuraphis noxia]XP_015368139.1 PREDICTED: SAGA-associated factor 29 [Diuraphis noxia]
MAMPKSIIDTTVAGKENSNEQTLLVKLFKMLFNLPPTKLSTEAVIDIINDTQEQVIKKGTIDPESQKSLTSFYESADLETVREEETIRRMLDIIHEIRNIRHQNIKSLLQSQRSSTFLKLLQVTATRMPVWFPRHDEQPPPLCGAIEPLPSYVAKSGDLVAALVKQSGEERWIVAEAVAFKNGRYEVEDIDVKETNRNFTLEKIYVKPLPLMRADPVTCPDALFPCNQFVLAMYPQTTCFFKALVKAPPKTSYDGYEVLFEDDFNQYTIMMVVSQRFVVSYPPLEIIHKDEEMIEF